MRDAKTVASLVAMVVISDRYCAEPSELSPNSVVRLLLSSVVKVRLSMVSSSTFTFSHTHPMFCCFMLLIQTLACALVLPPCMLMHCMTTRNCEDWVVVCITFHSQMELCEAHRLWQVATGNNIASWSQLWLHDHKIRGWHIPL